MDENSTERTDCPSSAGCSRESCEGCPSKSGTPVDLHEALNEFSHIGHVIGVVSGKGGVGKSMVTAGMAGIMRRAGYRVGIMDADVTGPSIPKMFGIHQTTYGSDAGILPIEAEDGTKVMSVNLLLEEEDAPVVWRGPVIAGMVKQFWTDVFWGELDYLFVDMPPGTGDVPLTVFQSIPIDGIVIVTSPQELVGLIVKKAYNMAQMMEIPVLGLVENYSYLVCPDCGKHIPVFGESHIEKTAEEYGLPVLGRLPMDPKLAASADGGRIFAESLDELSDIRGILDGLKK